MTETTEDRRMVRCIKNGKEIERPLDRKEFAFHGGPPKEIPLLYDGEFINWVEGDERPHIFMGRL